MTLQHGDWLNNRYYIEDKLGQGGAGAVYLAYDEEIDQQVAIKESLHDTSDAARQFEREATILARLHHPNLPEVLDYFEDHGLYLVMDFIDGLSLDHLLHNRGQPLTEAEAIPWIEQICSALTYLHQRNPPIIHRDVKPGNIIITPDNRAVLVDFGIAKFYQADGRTTTSAKGYSHGYAPPEQYGGSRTDARTDVYAVGATLFKVLTNQVPPNSMDRVAHTSFPIPRHLNPHISPHVEQVILKAVELSSQQRFQSIASFNQALYNPQFQHTHFQSSTHQSSTHQPPTHQPPTHQPPTHQPPTHQPPTHQPLTHHQPLSSQSSASSALQPHVTTRTKSGINRQWIAIWVTGVILIVLAMGIWIASSSISTERNSISNQPTVVSQPIINQPTAVISQPPTATPIPLIASGIYPINRCTAHTLAVGVQLQLCITQIMVQSDHTSQVQVAWTGIYQDNTYHIKKGSDVGNSNMYLTDNLGHRYDHTQVGGAAAQDVQLSHNQPAQGWFLFPTFQPRATIFTFHDDDLGQKIEGIVLR